MKDNKLFKISIAEIAVGAVLELLALAKVMGDSDILAGMGSGILAVGAVQMFRAFRIQSNPEYRKRMETAAKDERYAFISMKAKEAAVHRMDAAGKPGAGDARRHVDLPACAALRGDVSGYGAEILKSEKEP